MVYIALLRGINVGGKNIVKTQNLRQIFQDLGFQSVETYIQSGNVLFVSEEKSEVIKQKIEYAIEKTLGLTLSVILRTLGELNEIIENCPFPEIEIARAKESAEGEVLYVAMFAQDLSEENKAYLNAYESEEEKCVIAEKNIYLFCYRSFRKSKLTGKFLKTNTPSTIRNWNTMLKLAILANNLK